MRKRICLITPPSTFLHDERVFANLGILMVAAVLEKEGWCVEKLDLSGVPEYEKMVTNHLLISEATLVGITATTPQFPATAKIVCAIRKLKPSVKIIIGGPHVTLVSTAYKNEQKQGLVEGRATLAFKQLENMFDVLVAGDGENAIFEAVKPDAPKLIDADDRKSYLFLNNSTLTDNPFPARHLLDIRSYHYQIDGKRALSLIAQLGCPFNCGFCGGRNSPMLRVIRTRTSENIVAEMVHMYETWGNCGFMFYDDELNVNQSIVELMDLITKTQEELGVEWRLRGFIKSQLFTEEQAEAMYRAGFREILVGFESGSPRILENIRKMATREQNTKCVEIAHQHKLRVKALMSIGHPGESLETVKQTLEWLLEVKPEQVDVSVITPYMGTPYHDDAVLNNGVWTYIAKSGDRQHQRSLDFTVADTAYKGPEYYCSVWTDYMSAEEILRERNKLEDTVLCELGISSPISNAAINFDHSMGQGPHLPSSILRTSGG